MKVYPNLETFYSEDSRRRPKEADYGVGWKDREGYPYRVSYVQATGEVYAVRLPDTAPNSRVYLLGVIRPDNPDPLAHWKGTGERWYTTLDTILDGWWDGIPQPASIDWVAERIQPWQGGAL